MRALHRKIFEDQMRALEQQQQQELLTLPLDTSGNSSLQHMAMSAPTTPPRVNAVLNEDISPSLRTSFAQVGVDVDVLSRAVGSAVDKRKSVTYAPITRSPEIPPGAEAVNGNLSQGYGRAGAKSMPASRRTSASSHDEDLASHLHELSLAGERHSPLPPQDSMMIQRGNGRRDVEGMRYGNAYNAGMLLDEQLDEEMHSELLPPYHMILSEPFQMLCAICRRLMTTSIRGPVSTR